MITDSIEPEFCLKKESYLTLFPEEDGSLWDIRHPAEMQLFHHLFQTDRGQDILADELRTYPLGWSKMTTAFWNNAFEKREFNEDEYKFIQWQIKHRRK